MPPSTIAVIGVGKFGEIHLKALTQAHRSGQVRLVALADVNEKLLEQRQRECAAWIGDSSRGPAVYADYKEMLAKEKPAMVTIATPDYLHRQITLDCLAAEAHVLVEKPMDVTVEGCRAMIEAARAKGRILQVDFHKRYDPYHRELAASVAAGKLGRVEYGYAHIEDRIEVPRDWFPKWAPKSSPVWFLGVHMIDLVRWIIRSECVEVYATGMKEKLASLGIDTYDSVQATLRFENGASFTVQSSWILPDSFEAIVDQGIRIVGSEGMAEVDSQYRGARACLPQSDGARMATWNLGFIQERRDARGLPIWVGYGVEAILDFVDNVTRPKEGSTPPEGSISPTGEDGLAVTAIAEAIHRSLERQQSQRVTSF
jgi:predicted dehydrogenase